MAQSALCAQPLPGGLGQLSADDLYDFAGTGRSFDEAMGQRTAEGMAMQKTSGKKIAGTGGVDDVGHFGGRFAHAVIALHGESTARSAFDHGRVARAGEYVRGFLADLPSHGARLVFVGEYNIYMGQ